jgi:hypothetical protein
MIKLVEFPTGFHDVYAVTINGITFINTSYDDSETVTLFIPLIKIQLVQQVAPA